jgi:phospholipid/cholesterol/gamma-HCH transport system substrate-binding protein
VSSQNRYVRLGIFVLGAIALLVISIIVLGVGSMFKHYVRVETYFADSVQGLEVGAPVKYRGVTIGKVESISLLSAEYEATDKGEDGAIGRLIRVVMDIDPAPLPTRDPALLRKAMAAQTQRGFRMRLASSLTGPAYLEADFLDPDAYPPLAISWTPEHLYVPSAPASTSRIVSAAERIAISLENAKIGEVIRHVDDLILDANKSINDLKTGQLGDQANQALQRIRASSERLEQILRNPAIDQTLSDVSAMVGNARAAVGDKDGNLQRMMDNLRSVSGQLKESTDRVNELVHDKRIDEMIASLNTTTQNTGPAMSDLRLMLRRLNLVITAQSRNLEAMISNLREITDNAASVTSDAKSNPSRLLFGQPPRRFEEGGKQR